MKYYSAVILLIMVIASLLQIAETKRIKSKAKTFITKYQEKKIKYCEYGKIEILPPSKFTTPDGCLKCSCTNKRFLCKPLAKSRKKKMRLGCY